MTKIFDIMLVDDYAVVIDRESRPKIGDYYYSTDTEKEWKVGIEFVQVLEEHNILHKLKNKVIATIGKRIKGLPLIELPDESELLAENKFSLFDETNDRTGEIEEENLQIIGHRESFMKGYKAAQQKGTFSEEDIRKAFYEGREILRVDEHNRIVFKEPTFKEWLRKRRKLPKRVELEVKYNRYMIAEGPDSETSYVQVTDPKRNIITPVNIFYE